MMTLCFLNNLSQKLTVLKRCAERIKQPLWFKVKGTIRGHRSYGYILCPLNIKTQSRFISM